MDSTRSTVQSRVAEDALQIIERQGMEMTKAIRTFTVNQNVGAGRIKIDLIPESNGKGFVWCHGMDTIADEGTIYKTVSEACQAAKSMYKGQAWDMRSSWQ